MVLDQEAPRLEPQVAAFKREIQGFFRPGESRCSRRRPATAPRRACGGRGPRARRQQRRGGRGAGPDRLAPARPRGEPRKPAIAATIGTRPGRASPEGRRQRRPQPGVRGRVVCVERNGRRLPPDDPVPPDGGADRAELLAVIPSSRATSADPSAAPTPGPQWSSRRGARPIRSWPRCQPTPTPSTSPEPGARRGRNCAPDGGAGAPRLPHGATPPTTCRRRPRSETTRPSTGGAAPSGGGRPPAHPGRRGCRHAAGAAVGAPRLTLNLATARTIGFSPGYSVRPTRSSSAPTPRPGRHGLAGRAMRGAVAAKLDIKAEDLEGNRRSGRATRRSNLLPRSRAGSAARGPGRRGPRPRAWAQPQRQLDGGLSFSVPLTPSRPGRLRLGAAPAGGPSSRRDRPGSTRRDAAQAYISVPRRGRLREVLLLEPVPKR